LQRVPADAGSCSEIYAYNASEYRMQPSQVGKDGGSSIHSGVRVLVEGIPALGVAQDLPTEQAWPYSQLLPITAAV
jgi:hypothetical protein